MDIISRAESRRAFPRDYSSPWTKAGEVAGNPAPIIPSSQDKICLPASFLSVLRLSFRVTVCIIAGRITRVFSLAELIAECPSAMRLSRRYRDPITQGDASSRGGNNTPREHDVWPGLKLFIDFGTTRRPFTGVLPLPPFLLLRPVPRKHYGTANSRRCARLLAQRNASR